MTSYTSGTTSTPCSPATSSRTPRPISGGNFSAPPFIQWRLPRCSSGVQPFQKQPKCPRWLSVSMWVPQCVYISTASPQ